MHLWPADGELQFEGELDLDGKIYVLNLIQYIVAGSVSGTGEVREVPKSVSLASFLFYIKMYCQIVVYCPYRQIEVHRRLTKEARIPFWH